MSSPYVAGAHALLFQARKKVLRGQDARQILMNTAVPGRYFDHAELAPVPKQGSGLINVKNAISVKVRVTRNTRTNLHPARFHGV